jgi:hypothetical protein
MTPETELRDRLASAASGADRWDDDWAAADAVIDRRRAEKRRRMAGSAVAAVVVAAVVLVPTLTTGWHLDNAPATSTTTPPATTTPATSAQDDVWSGATRGSLAGDEDFIATMRTREWQWGAASPDHRVLFAGDLGGRRWALLAGTVGGQLYGQWFAGAPGDPASALTAAGGGPLSGSGVSDGAVLSDQGGALVVLAQPGDQVSVSPGVVVDADGQVRREWTRLTTEDGVAGTDLPRASNAFEYRVERAGQTLAPVLTPGVTDYATTPQSQAIAAQEPRRASAGKATGTAVQIALQEVQTRLGLTVDQLRPVLLWTGPLPDPDGSSEQAVVLAMTVPSGAVVTSTAWGVPDDTPVVGEPSFGPGQPCGTSVFPAGTELDDLLVVAGCAAGQTIVHRELVVSAPRGVTQVQLATPAGSQEPQPLAGSGLIADPGVVTGITVSGPGVEPRTVALATRNPLDTGTG